MLFLGFFGYGKEEGRLYRGSPLAFFCASRIKRRGNTYICPRIAYTRHRLLAIRQSCIKMRRCEAEGVLFPLRYNHGYVLDFEKDGVIPTCY